MLKTTLKFDKQGELQEQGHERGGDCVFSIDLSAFNCRQAANESRKGDLWYVPQRINLNIARLHLTRSVSLSLLLVSKL